MEKMHKLPISSLKLAHIYIIALSGIIMSNNRLCWTQLVGALYDWVRSSSKWCKKIHL